MKYVLCLVAIRQVYGLRVLFFSGPKIELNLLFLNYDVCTFYTNTVVYISSRQLYH